jgi:hypothetical protein
MPIRKSHLLARRSVCIFLGDGLVNINGTLHGIHRAGEVGDEAISSRAEDPTPMRLYQPISDDPV